MEGAGRAADRRHMPDGEVVHVPHSLVKAARKGYVKPR